MWGIKKREKWTEIRRVRKIEKWTEVRRVRHYSCVACKQQKLAFLPVVMQARGREERRKVGN